MKYPETTRTVNRRALLVGAAATLPAVPVVALPAIIAPRTGLAAALQAHVDAVGKTCTPFAARRGMPEWAFTVSDYGNGVGGSLIMMFDEEDGQGWRTNRRLESYRINDGVLDMTVYQGKDEAIRRFNVDFPA